MQSGTNGSVLSITIQNPTNPLYTFAAVPQAGTIAGQVTIVTTGIPLLVPIQPLPGTPPVVINVPGSPPIVVPPLPVVLTTPLPAVLPVAAAVVPALLATPLSTDLSATILPAINALSDPGAVVLAVAQLAPSASDLAAPLVSFQMTKQFQDLWMTRMFDTFCSQTAGQGIDPVRQSGDALATCRDNNPRSGVWLKAFGQVASQDAKGAFTGYDSSIYGAMIGYDAPVGPNTRVGVGLGIGRGVIDGKTNVSDTTFNSYNLILYAGHEIGPWFVNGDISFGWNDYSGNRNIAFPGVNRRASASYSGQDYTAFATTGYHFFVQGITLTPIASIQFTHMNLGNYTETGAGDINLNVNSQSYDFVESGLGVKVAKPFAWRNGTYVPEMHFTWFHELSNPNIKNTAAFAVAGSPAFSTPGFRTADDTLNVGARFTILSCVCNTRPWSLEAAYDYYWTTEGYSSHRGTLRVATRF